MEFSKTFFQLKIAKILDRLNGDDPPLSIFFLFFLFIVLLRSYLEWIYSIYPLEVDSFFHVLFSFLWVATSIMVSTKVFFPKERLQTIGKLIFSSMVLILIPPTVDLIISGGKGLYMTYYIPVLYPKYFTGFWNGYFSFFGTYNGYGATPGIKTEIIIALFLAFQYSYLYQNKKIFISLLYALSIYTIVAVLGFFPYIFDKLFTSFNLLFFYYDHRIFGIYFLILTILNISVLLFLEKKVLVRKVFSPFFQFEFYYFIFLAVISGRSIEINQENLTKFILFFLSLKIIFLNLMDGEDKFTTGLKFKITSVISLFLAAYISFYALFFMTIFLFSNFFRGYLSKNLGIIFFGISSMSIMSLGHEINYPKSFPPLKIILLTLFISVIIYKIKALLYFKKIIKRYYKAENLI